MCEVLQFRNQNFRSLFGMRLFFTFFFFFVLSLNAFSQVPPTVGDCMGGIRVCEQSYTQESSYIGYGNVNDLPVNQCLTGGESNSAWYIINVENTGLFGFNIIPNISNADYDWVLYDITYASCDDIQFNPTLSPLSCNFSSMIVPTPVTGMNNGTNNQDMPMALVPAGSILALCVNNFSGLNNAGYTLQFNIPGSTADIIDNSPPALSQSNVEAACSSPFIYFSFGEYVNCESVDVEDFTLVFVPTGDTIEINEIVGTACANGGVYEKDFIAVLPQPLFIGGEYNLWRNGQIVDLCGNVAANPEFIFIELNLFELQVDTNLIESATCPNPNGEATVDLQSSSPSDTYTYTWYPSGVNFPPAPTTDVSVTFNQLPYGNNWVVVENQDGCFQSTDTFFVKADNKFIVYKKIIDDTCSSQIGKVYLTPYQDPMPTAPNDFTYFWDVPGQIVNNDTIDGLLPGTYSFTVTNPAGCIYRDSAVVPDFRYNLAVDFLFSPDENPITGIFPTVTFINLSDAATEYIWDFGSGDTSDVFEPQYIFPGSGTYDVQLMAINQFGCKDSVTKQVTIDFLLNQYFPTAFTPDGDNINDTFNFVATGIIESTFEMQVFDKWGGQVFQTNDVRQGWDGKSPSGLSLPAGVYAYKVFFYDQSGKKRQIRGRFVIYS